MSAFFERRRPVVKSCCGLAFNDETGEAVVAERAAAGGGFNIWRVPFDERRAINITADEVRTVVTGWSAHTDRSQTIISGADSNDEAVLRSLAEAVKNLPNANSTNFAWARTPDRRITITQAERSDVERTALRATQWLNEQQPSHTSFAQRQPRLQMETATRTVARLWFSEASGNARRTAAVGTAAFVIIGRDGYAVGLWGASQIGLIYETEELFEIGASAEMAVAHACESIVKLIAPSNLSRLELEEPVSIVVSAAQATPGEMLCAALADELDEGITVEPVRFSGAPERSGGGDTLDQATAFALGAILDAEEVPIINLASDLEAQHRALIAAEEERALSAARRQVTLAKAAIWAPFALGASLLLTSYLDLRRESARTSEQTKIEERRAAALKAESNLRLAAKQHYAEYVALTEQTLELRHRQPASAQLLNDLNQQWPVGDPSWYIAEMKMLIGGAIELKGRTAREESVTAFTRGLEFSNGLFTNVSNNIQTAISNDAARSNNGNSATLDFTVRAVYTPLLKNAAGKGSAPAPLASTSRRDDSMMRNQFPGPDDLTELSGNAIEKGVRR